MADTFDCTNIRLTQGQNNDKVKQLQTILKNLGYYTGKLDGQFGQYTYKAVYNFQNAYHLTKDGIFGPQTCKKLNEVVSSKNKTNNTTTSTKTSGTSTTSNTVQLFDCPNTSLSRGSKGEKVKQLQTMLKALGYYTTYGGHKLIVDGDYGYYTQLAVKAYQNAKGHDPDGWFGPKTCKTLNQAYQTKVGVTSNASNAATSSSSSNTTNNTPVTPEHLKKVTAKLTILPSVVVLPDTSFDETTQKKTVTGGSIDTETNFDCSKINLSRGSKGDDVKKLQTVLKARGYYKRQVDGDYGDYTVRAVKQLQSAQGNDPDGQFGPKTCNKLQGTTNTGASTSTDKKNQKYTITDFKSISTTDDIEGLSHEVTVQTPYTTEKHNSIRKLQKTQFEMYYDTEIVYGHEGYINEIKVTQEDSMMVLEISLVGYTAFLDAQLEYEKTAKRSELIKDICKLANLKAEVDLTGLEDSEFTVKVQKAEATGTSGGSGLTEMSNNDCTGHMQTNGISKASFDINVCGGNTKIGNSSANYAVDTQNKSGKEAILDVYHRFKYGRPGNSSAYDDNERCPRTMWNTSGKIYGNCADIARLIKCIGDVHGIKVGIRHAYHHYYNLIEVNGKTYRFDCCFQGSGGYMKGYGGEMCNNLTKNGGPWQ